MSIRSELRDITESLIESGVIERPHSQVTPPPSQPQPKPKEH